MLLAAYTGPRRAFALGVWSGVAAAALADGPLVGAALTRTFGWPAILWINVPLGAALLLAAGLTIHPAEPRHATSVTSAAPPARQRVDVAGLVCSAIGLSALVFGLTQASAYGWTSSRLSVILAVALVALSGLVMVERHAAAPLLDLSLFRRPSVLAANLLALPNLAVMCSLFFFLSLYLQLVGGASALRTGITLLPLSPNSGPATSPKPTLSQPDSPPVSAPASQSTPASPWPRQPSRPPSTPTLAQRRGTRYR